MAAQHFIAAIENVDPTADPPEHKSQLNKTAKRIERSHVRAQQSFLDGVWHAYRAGDELLTAKTIIPRGGWETWLAEKLPAISVRTCQRYMKLARTLRSLTDFPGDDGEEEPSKTTRASQLNFLHEHGFTSWRESVRLEKQKSTGLEGQPFDQQSSDHPAPSRFDSDDDWQTPADILSSAFELFGTIDLDPCGTNEFRLPVARTFTKSQNGLAPESAWEGRMLIHPPTSNVEPFLQRACEAVEGDPANEALIFMRAEMDAPCMKYLQPYAKAFLHSRPTLVNPAGEAARPAWPYMLIFVSQVRKRNNLFAEAFGPLADIYRPHRF